eukprot:scaffold6_cov330-Pavlova_lutheri.AAC.27
MPEKTRPEAPARAVGRPRIVEQQRRPRILEQQRPGAPARGAGRPRILEQQPPITYDFAFSLYMEVH